MSSILDALNKLEQEKAQASHEAERSDTDPVSIANELVGRSVMHDRVTLRVTPVALFVSVGALVVGLVVVTFVAAMMLTRPDRAASPAAETLAAAPSVAVEGPAATSASQDAPPAPAPAIDVPKPADATAPVTVAPKEAPKPADPAAAAPPASVDASIPPATKVDPPASAPEVSAPKPENTVLPAKGSDEPKQGSAADESDPVVKAPASAPRPRTRVAAKPEGTTETPPRALPGSASGANRTAEVSLETLPILTPQDQIRFGFTRLKVNMVKPSGDTNPQGSAILTLEEESSTGDPVVNRMPFYEGQRLQQSTLRLFKVGPDRVGIEDMRSGERYQLPI